VVALLHQLCTLLALLVLPVSSSALLYTAQPTRLSRSLCAASTHSCGPCKRSAELPSCGRQAGRTLTELRWSFTLAAAFLEQPPDHVTEGCAGEVDSDVRECLQALTMQGTMTSEP
jgi:hypothetical protein